MKRLPLIDAQYWALIISATTMGETAGDLISQSLNLGYGGGTIFLISLFVLALIAALFSKIQHQALYWTVITLASTAGTTLSDYFTRTLSRALGFDKYLSAYFPSFGIEELGYIVGTALLIVILAVIFGIWHFVKRKNEAEDTLNPLTEFLYWLAILTSSTLGTALGDLLAHDTPLGFGGGTLLLLSLLAIVVLMVFFTKISREVCYWLAIIVTHPIGATMGDYLTKKEGLGLGNVWASLLLVGVFILVILAGKFRKKA
jgi:uncharacterized membrane-anchored protein